MGKRWAGGGRRPVLDLSDAGAGTAEPPVAAPAPAPAESADAPSPVEPKNPLLGLLGEYDDEEEEEDGAADDSGVAQPAEDSRMAQPAAAGSDTTLAEPVWAPAMWRPWGDWQQCLDAGSQAHYYWNTSTDEVRWTRPEEPAATAPAPPPPKPDSLPSEGVAGGPAIRRVSGETETATVGCEAATRAAGGVGTSGDAAPPVACGSVASLPLESAAAHEPGMSDVPGAGALEEASEVLASAEPAAGEDARTGASAGGEAEGGGAVGPAVTEIAAQEADVGDRPELAPTSKRDGINAALVVAEVEALPAMAEAMAPGEGWGTSDAVDADMADAQGAGAMGCATGDATIVEGGQTGGAAGAVQEAGVIEAAEAAQAAEAAEMVESAEDDSFNGPPSTPFIGPPGPPRTRRRGKTVAAATGSVVANGVGGTAPKSEVAASEMDCAGLEMDASGPEQDGFGTKLDGAGTELDPSQERSESHVPEPAALSPSSPVQGTPDVHSETADSLAQGDGSGHGAYFAHSGMAVWPMGIDFTGTVWAGAADHSRAMGPLSDGEALRQSILATVEQLMLKLPQLRQSLLAAGGGGVVHSTSGVNSVAGDGWDGVVSTSGEGQMLHAALGEGKLNDAGSATNEKWAGAGAISGAVSGGAGSAAGDEREDAMDIEACAGSAGGVSEGAAAGGEAAAGRQSVAECETGELGATPGIASNHSAMGGIAGTPGTGAGIVGAGPSGRDMTQGAVGALRLLFQLEARRADFEAGALDPTYLWHCLHAVAAQVGVLEAEGLPEGWARAWDSGSSSYYFAHAASGAAQWGAPWSMQEAGLAAGVDVSGSAKNVAEGGEEGKQGGRVCGRRAGGAGGRKDGLGGLGSVEGGAVLGEELTLSDLEEGEIDGPDTAGGAVAPSTRPGACSSEEAGRDEGVEGGGSVGESSGGKDGGESFGKDAGKDEGSGRGGAKKGGEDEGSGKEDGTRGGDDEAGRGDSGQDGGTRVSDEEWIRRTAAHVPIHPERLALIRGRVTGAASGGSAGAASGGRTAAASGGHVGAASGGHAMASSGRAATTGGAAGASGGPAALNMAPPARGSSPSVEAAPATAAGATAFGADRLTRNSAAAGSSSVPKRDEITTTTAAAPAAAPAAPKSKKRPLKDGGGALAKKRMGGLVQKWNAVRAEVATEMEAEEEAAHEERRPRSLLDLEEEKRARLAEWKTTLSSEEVAANSNFAPIKGDWRARVASRGKKV